MIGIPRSPRSTGSLLRVNNFHVRRLRYRRAACGEVRASARVFPTRQDQAIARLGFFLISQRKAYRKKTQKLLRDEEKNGKWKMENGKSLISQQPGLVVTEEIGSSIFCVCVKKEKKLSACRGGSSAARLQLRVRFVPAALLAVLRTALAIQQYTCTCCFCYKHLAPSTLAPMTYELEAPGACRVREAPNGTAWPPCAGCWLRMQMPGISIKNQLHRAAPPWPSAPALQTGRGRESMEIKVALRR
jgi:hypothetical protein